MNQEIEFNLRDDQIEPEFTEWWEKEGCLIRSGGGDYERTFAFGAFRHLMPEVMAARESKKTPTWTKEDYAARRLPAVGCEIFGFITGNNTVLFNDGEHIITHSHSGAVGKYNKAEVFSYFRPIEISIEGAGK